MASYNLKTLFKPADQTQETPVSPATGVSNPDAKRSDETYIYYGSRICGRVTASLPALSAFLHRVYNGEKRRQINDEQLQIQHKEELRNRLHELESKIAYSNSEINQSEQKIENINNRITDLKAKLVEAKNLNGQVNKMAKVKLIIGLTILAILTIYLFLFYSSTFYSAFFKVFDIEDSIGVAMFDSQAIPNAFKDGFSELMFILSAPIIFMGLGYGLHFFMQQKSWTRWIKSASVLCITLLFDCILAYLIAKRIYDVDALTKLGDFPDFSVKIAITDVNFWAVIFCGFIVYLIWGLVFDMAMSAYEDLRSNKKEIAQIEVSINNQQDSLADAKALLANKKAKLESLLSEKNEISEKLSKNYFYDVQIIRNAMSDFFAGWMALMPSLCPSTNDQQEANNIYHSTVTQLFD